MNTTFRITRDLVGRVRADLARRHSFAHERVGFIVAGASGARGDLILVGRAYQSVRDEDYLRDPSVGAMMGPEAIRSAMQTALSADVAMLHVHAHSGFGVPGFSGVDLTENRKFIPSFFNVAPRCAHGAIVLSGDKAAGQIWLSRDGEPRPIDEFVEVGAPLKSWRAS